MKIKINLFILSFIVITGNCQSFKYLKPHLTDSTTIITSITDTINSYEKLVYIDFKKHSDLKDNLINFNATDKNMIESISKTYYGALKNEKIKPAKVKISIPDKWVKLNKYHGNWMLLDDIPKFVLTDSCLVIIDMDDPFSNVIKNISHFDNLYHFNLIAYNWKNPKINIEYSLEIKILDSKRMITFWKFDFNDQSEYYIMIPCTQVINFPIIGILTTDFLGDENNIFDAIDFNLYK
jgi:hypothetical protein